MSAVVRTTDGARSPSHAHSFLIEVDGDGLAYERVVFDLAANGIALHALEDDPVEWRLFASVRSEGAMPSAQEVLSTYFGHRLRRCVDRRATPRI